MTDLERRPGYRRVSCACGCGRWFYVEAKVGRPRKYADHPSFDLRRLAQKHQRWAARLMARAQQVEARP